MERIPEQYKFDAGGFPKSESDPDFPYRRMSVYAVGLHAFQLAETAQKFTLLYDWSAFLLNFWAEYFRHIDSLENLMTDFLNEMKIRFNQHDFSGYKPIHPTLTLYENGSNWFSDEQNELIRWYRAKDHSSL